MKGKFVLECSFIILNYERPELCKKLINSIQSQNLACEIILINNSRQAIDVNVERAIHIPWNSGCYSRLAFLPWSRSEYTCFIDDDLMLAHNGVVREWIQLYNEMNSPIIGGWGAKASTDGYEWNYQSNNKLYNIIKGRSMFFRTNIACHLPLLSKTTLDPKHFRRGVFFEDDIYFSLNISKGKETLFAGEAFRRNLIDNEKVPGQMGLSSEKDHDAIRSEVAKELFGYVTSNLMKRECWAEE